MPTVAIEKYRDSGTLPQNIWEELNSITEQVRRQAFDLFERRGHMIGSDLDNWLAAEREVVWTPPSEIIEKNDGFQARIALPGFKPQEVQVVATPDALIIESEATHSHQSHEGKVCLCEFSDKRLFRRLDLPAKIDVDRTTAQLDNGMLQVNAPKAKAA